MPVFRWLHWLVLGSLLWVGCRGELLAGRAPLLPTVAPTAVGLNLPPPPTPPVLPVTLATPLPLPTRFIAATAPPLATIRRPATASPLATATAVPPRRVGITGPVPPDLLLPLQTAVKQRPDLWQWVGVEAADLAFGPNQGVLFSRWLYVTAAPFATLVDDVTTVDLATAWQSGQAAPGRLIVDEATAAALTTLWGAPGAVTVTTPENLVPLLWQSRPSWTILPFHELTPDLKVLRLDGQSPLEPAFNGVTYPLVVPFGWRGDSTAVAQLRAAWQLPPTNYDANRLTRVAMTGVTALTRAVAYQMELNGVNYPGEAVAPVLRAADIAHISHEVAFAANCPYPNPVGGTTFCARDHYLELLQGLGTGVVELTGNHVNDWGAENLSHTIDLYQDAGMAYFGGGRDLDDAARPALFAHNGNRIAFIGCNPVGPAYAWATANRAGSRPCDYEALQVEIQQLRAGGYLVIATLQYWEFYHYAATAQQKVDFRRLATAGAAAVSGSQGHHPQGFDFHEGAFIHYGLGNLFFDQMDSLTTRQSFVDTYLIYDGRLLSVELWTGLIENWSRPRPMTEAERRQLLQAVFQASGW
jgi:poly-gamma-glutamate capsule biosynthesis protein CapA/YwtB (metallophosphatase superfamily)